MSVLSGLDVDMCNVHAAGTKAMMQAALEGLTRPDGSRPLLIAVTEHFYFRGSDERGTLDRSSNR